MKKRETGKKKDGSIRDVKEKKKPEWMLKVAQLSANQSVPPPLLLVSRLCDWPGGSSATERERESRIRQKNSSAHHSSISFSLF